ncbi:MAG: c-type cytochrome [Sulfurovum sp.]|jgi:cytochrome c553
MNILGKKLIFTFIASAAILFTGCTEEKEAETKVEVQTEQSNSKIITDASKEVVNTVSEATSQVIENLKNDETVEETKKMVVETTKEVVNDTMKTAEKIVNETVNTVAPAVAKAIENVAPTKVAVDGKKLYASCAACHGANAEKKALNMSQVIAGWDKQKIMDALNGYKDGTYGGPMKGVMVGQVSTKTPEEIEALATFISGL